jgi:hypothetical protein
VKIKKGFCVRNVYSKVNKMILKIYVKVYSLNNLVLSSNNNRVRVRKRVVKKGIEIKRKINRMRFNRMIV